MSADITKCSNEKCKLKDKCYRYLATDDQWQSYALFKPVKGKCEHYWEVSSKSQMRRFNVLSRFK